MVGGEAWKNLVIFMIWLVILCEKPFQQKVNFIDKYLQNTYIVLKTTQCIMEIYSVVVFLSYLLKNDVLHIRHVNL